MIDETLYPIYKQDGSLFFPHVPIHPEVLKNGNLDNLNEIQERFYAMVKQDMNKIYSEEEANRYFNFVKNKCVEPKMRHPFLIQGVFSINCDSICTERFGGDYDLFSNLSKDNIVKLNETARAYEDEKGYTTLVFSHNARSETPDPILHKAWAIAVNNVTLEKLI
jgi:hypothetical protein